jgi:flagellar protein FlbD
MIKLTRYNGADLLINENFIETVEETPDTVITMQNTHRYFVKEDVNGILEKIADFQKEIRRGDSGGLNDPR